MILLGMILADFDKT